MKKIYLALIIGILLVGTVFAIKVSLKDDWNKLSTIDSKEICSISKEIKSDCDGLSKDGLDVSGSKLTIEQNSEGVIKVSAE